MHKDFILAVICIFFSGGIKLNAQAYIPFPDSNYAWNDMYTIYDAPCIPFGQRQFYISGDTLINSFTYHKLYVNESTGNLWCTGNVNQYLHVLTSCIRQDIPQKKVYAFDFVNSVDTLLYDFNLTLGTVYPKTLFTDDSVLYVTRIDTTLLGDGMNHQIFFFSRFQPCAGGDSISNDLALIEGVGFTTGFGFQTTGAAQPLSVYGPGILAQEAPQLECFGTYTTLHGRVNANGNCQRDTTFYNPADSPCLINMVTENLSNEIHIIIQPNPSDKEILITTPDKMIGYSFCIVSNLGQTVYKNSFSSVITSIDLTDYPTGVYYLIASKGEFISSFKFIKK